MTSSKLKKLPLKGLAPIMPSDLGLSADSLSHNQKVLNQLNAVFPTTNNTSSSNVDVLYDEESPRGKTISVIMRPDNDGTKISEQEKKNIKKQFLNVF